MEWRRDEGGEVGDEGRGDWRSRRRSRYKQLELTHTHLDTWLPTWPGVCMCVAWVWLPRIGNVVVLDTHAEEHARTASIIRISISAVAIWLLVSLLFSPRLSATASVIIDWQQAGSSTKIRQVAVDDRAFGVVVAARTWSGLLPTAVNAPSPSIKETLFHLSVQSVDS